MGKVLKADGAVAQAYVEVDLGSDQPDLWQTTRLGFDQAAIDAWQSDGFSGTFIDLLSSGFADVNEEIDLFDPGAGLEWRSFQLNTAGETPVAGMHLVEIHHQTGALNDVYLDGSLIASGTPLDTLDARMLRVGLVGGSFGAGRIVYVDYAYAGTSRGASDIFGDSFEDGTTDAWDTLEGDVSVIDDPFPAESPMGIVIAFDDPTMEPAPTWTRLDEPGTAAPWRVNGFTISRGRQAEFDKTGTGQATVTLSDPTGAFDPTNASSPFAGLLDPMKQAAIKIQNPVTEDWRWLFRGFVAEWPGDLNQTSRMETVELELVDGFALLERTRMYPGTATPPAFGTVVPFGTEGDIYFAQTSGTAQVRGRINQVLDQADWGLERHTFSGNIDLQPTIYSRGESVLTVLLDCADAEFPGVSQIICSRRGGVVFRGRYARFDPTAYIATDDDDLRSGPAGTGGRLWPWQCGGRPECDAGTALALISDIGWRRSDKDIINIASAVPNGATDEEAIAQVYKDDTSIAQFGQRSGPDMENLIVFEGNTPPGQTNLEETKFYAEYYVENYKAPQTRITTLTFRGLPLQDPAASPTWSLICGVEIGDPIHVTTSHFGTAGGFDDDYLIEGIRYTAEPAHNSMWDITLELDVSPQSFYAHNPWGTAIPGDDQDTPAE